MPFINDEPLYVDYMQKINTNWIDNKRISVDNTYNDWKPPLQYWYGSLFVNSTDNPIVSARISSILF